MGLFDLGDNKPKITDSEMRDARLHMRGGGLSKEDADLVEGVIRSHGSDKGVGEKDFEGGVEWLAKHGKEHGLTSHELEKAAEELRKKL